MQLIAQYPISEAALIPYFGRPVGAVLANGDCVCGIMDRMHEGNVVFRPITNVPPAVLAQVKKSVKAKLKTMNLPKIPYSIKSMPKMQISSWGYPLGWGFGNWGWGAGWWWIWPLIFLTALFAFPFFWI